MLNSVVIQAMLRQGLRLILFILTLTVAPLFGVYAQDLSGLITNEPLAANEDGESQVCAAVWPCDEDGVVRPEFTVGSCGVIYALQCAAYQSRQISYDLQVCSDESQNLAGSVSYLRKQVRRVRRVLYLQRLCGSRCSLGLRRR